MKSVFTAIIAAFMALAINAPAFAASAKLTEPVFQALKSTKSGKKLLDTVGIAANADAAAANALINGLSSTQTAAVLALITQFQTQSVGTDGKLLDVNALNALADKLFLDSNKQALSLAAIVQLNTRAVVKGKPAAAGETCNIDALMEGTDGRVTKAEVISAMQHGFLTHGVCGKDVQTMASLPKSNLFFSAVYMDKVFMAGKAVTKEVQGQALFYAQNPSYAGKAVNEIPADLLAMTTKAANDVAETCGYFPKAVNQ